MALTTLAAYKTFAGITGSANDGQLSAFLEGADATIKAWCGQNLEQAEYADYYHGNGRALLMLRQRPVTEVEAVYLDPNGNFGDTTGAFASGTLLTEGTDYALRRDRGEESHCGMLVRINGVWPRSVEQWDRGRIAVEPGSNWGNIKVTYTAGYATVPNDLVYACHFLISWMRRNAPEGGVYQSETLGQYSYTLAGNAIGQFPELGSLRQVLSRYRELVV